MFYYSIIFNLTYNDFLHSVYLDINGQIYHDKGNCHNCCKYMQFFATDFAYGLCQELGIYQAIWCLSFPIFSQLYYNEEQFLLCNQDILYVFLPGSFISLFQSTGFQSSPLQYCSINLQGYFHPTTYKPYQDSRHQHY